MFASGQQPYPAGVGRVPLRGFWIRGTLSGGGGGVGNQKGGDRRAQNWGGCLEREVKSWDPECKVLDWPYGRYLWIIQPQAEFSRVLPPAGGTLVILRIP